jgi:hypothetical protein
MMDFSFASIMGKELTPRRTSLKPGPASRPRARRVSWLAVAVAAGLAAFALVGWQAVTTVGRSSTVDSQEYLLNAAYLDTHGWLPPQQVSYEYSAPPLFEALAVGAERLAAALPAVALEFAGNVIMRLLWLLLVVGSVACVWSRSGRLKRAGAVGLAVGLVWGLDEAIALAKTEPWAGGQLLALCSALGLVVVSGLIALEIWPGQARRAIATAGFVIAYPVVLRLGSLFHPETTMAFISTLVVLVVVRAARRGWPVRLGALAGVLCGLDFLTRQSAIVVVSCALVAAVACGRWRARSFVLATVAGILLVAGPWLGYAAYTWGNPLQGNLNRQGDMLIGGEPRSFYVSFPIRALVLHPQRDHFANQLMPQLHADLWSDWFGEFHDWAHASAVDRVTASGQSVLGLVGDALALGGLAAIGLPALLRVAHRRIDHGRDFVFGFLALITLVGLIGFTAQIVRYPQIGGIEIKSNYLLFAAPCFAVFSVAAWLALARSSRSLQALLASVAVLYVLSYSTALAAVFARNHPPLLRAPITFGHVDLRLTMRGLHGPSRQGSEPQIEMRITNTGTETATHLELRISLDPGMVLLGLPYTERGPGCAGLKTVTCNLDFLPAGMSTPIRFQVQLTKMGAKQITASASSLEHNSRPAVLYTYVYGS